MTENLLKTFMVLSHPCNPTNGCWRKQPESESDH